MGEIAVFLGGKGGDRRYERFKKGWVGLVIGRRKKGGGVYLGGRKRTRERRGKETNRRLLTRGKHIGRRQGGRTTNRRPPTRFYVLIMDITDAPQIGER
jgi:hypothetical protein